MGPRMIPQHRTPTIEHTSAQIACFFALAAEADIMPNEGGGVHEPGAPPNPPGWYGEYGAAPKLGGGAGAPNEGGAGLPKLELLLSLPKLVLPAPGLVGGGYEAGVH